MTRSDLMILMLGRGGRERYTKLLYTYQTVARGVDSQTWSETALLHPWRILPLVLGP